MSLSHVYYWEPHKGYRPISVDEASNLYREKVSVDEGRFICGLCAQQVGLSKRRIDSGTRYFYHSRGEQNKECEDRARAYDRAVLQINSHPMPIRLKVTGSSFAIELGFFFPKAIQDRPSGYFQIIVHSDAPKPIVYSSERIQASGITYLSVGTAPSSRYQFEYKNLPTSCTRFWPAETEGIPDCGAFFDYQSGRMFPAGFKLSATEKFYLLQPRPLTLIPRGIISREIRVHRGGLGTFRSWYLYSIQVTEFSERVARFFLDRFILLSEKPTRFYPIWPPYVKDPYFIYHTDPVMYFYMEGMDADLKMYPEPPSYYAPFFESVDSGKLYKIRADGCEQLLSLGQFGSMDFSYLIRKETAPEVEIPKILVKDIHGYPVKEDFIHILPENKTIFIESAFDGKVVLLRRGQIQQILWLSPSRETEISDLSYGMEVQIFQGCDLMRHLVFEHEHSKITRVDLDQELIQKLESCRGTDIPAVHSLGALANRLQDCPRTRLWLQSVIRKGRIKRSAYNLLLNTVLKREDMKK